MYRRFHVPAAAFVVMAVVAGCATGPAGNITMDALWYGTASDGAEAYGVTRIGIEASHEPSTADLVIDTDGYADAGTGAAWNASTYSAAGVALLAAGQSPVGTTIRFFADESIDGPSAGTLMATGVLADLQGCVPDATTTVTGALLPDGTIAAVGGVPDKIRAAAEAGLTRVLIPTENQTSLDRSTGRSVDPVALGAELGVQVVPVSSMLAAYGVLCPEQAQDVPLGWPTAHAPMLAVIATGARRAWRRLVDVRVAPGADRQRASVAHRRRVVSLLERALRQVPPLLGKGRVIEAYALGELADREVAMWNARSRVRSRAQAPGSGAGPQRHLLGWSRRLEENIRSRLADAAATEVTTQEQMGQLPDALSWGTDALATTVATREDLETPGLPAGELGFAAADLAAAKYDALRVMPLTIEAMMTTGSGAVADPDAMLSTIDAYARFLTAAADDNVEYAATADIPTLPEHDLPDQRLARILRTRAQQLVAAPSGRATVMLRASTALSYFVNSVSVVAAEGLIAGASGQAADSPDRLQILDPVSFTARSTVSARQARGVARTMLVQGLDPSYLQWGTRWGHFVAAGSDDFPASARREGLVYQWYAEIQARMTLSLGGG